MKKLMIAAAIVCAAALSQAASVQWQTSNIKYGSSYVGAKVNDQFNPAQAFLIWGADIDTVTASLAAGNTLTVDGLAVLDGGNSGENTRGNVSGIFTFDTSKEKFSGLQTGGKAYDFYAVVIYNDPTKGPLYEISSVKSAALYDETNQYAEKTGPKFSTTELPSAAAGWKAYGAAPEPTSGLLLLLGVAGLALKRKRA